MKRHGLILLVVLGAAPAAGAQTAIEVRTSFGATNYQQDDLEYAAPTMWTSGSTRWPRKTRSAACSTPSSVDPTEFESLRPGRSFISVPFASRPNGHLAARERQPG